MLLISGFGEDDCSTSNTPKAKASIVWNTFGCVIGARNYSRFNGAMVGLYCVPFTLRAREPTVASGSTLITFFSLRSSHRFSADLIFRFHVFRACKLVAAGPRWGSVEQGSGMKTLSKA